MQATPGFPGVAFALGTHLYTDASTVVGMRKVETVKRGGKVTSYKVRFRHGVSPRTGKPLQTSEPFPATAVGKKQAEAFARWLDALGPQGALDKLYEDRQAETVDSMDQVAADHIQHLTGIEDGTRIVYTRLWERTWSPLLGAIPANQLGSDHVKAAVNTLGERYARKSLENQRGLLSAVCERAREKGYLTSNPTKGIRLPDGKRVEVADLDDDDDDAGEMTCLTHDEFEALYSVMQPHYQSLIRFLAGTGCRWGEAVVLRKMDVDLGAGTVKVRRALKWSPDGKRKIGPPKTKKSRRTIALPGQVADDLAVLLEGKAGRDLVFTAPRGGMISHRTFWSKNWRPAIWRAQHCAEHSDEKCRCGTGEPQRCPLHKKPPAPCGCAGTLSQSPRLHDLRHSHASWLLAAGVPIHIVQLRLGHESIKTTVDTYGHLLPDAQAMASSAASLAFARRPALEQ